MRNRVRPFPPSFRSLPVLIGLCQLLPGCDPGPAETAEFAEEDLETPESEESRAYDIDLVDVDPDDEDAPAPGPPLGPDGFTDGTKPVQIGAVSYWSWGAWPNQSAELDMGSASDRTCFLQGVTGSLEGQWQGTTASVDIGIGADNRWKLLVQAGPVEVLMGHAACIPKTLNRTFMSWAGNNENNQFNHKIVAPQVGPRSPFTQCFLTGVSGTDGWKSPTSVVVLKKENIWEAGTGMTPKWTLSGNLLWEQDNTSGGSASAVCVDFGQDVDPYDWQSAPGSFGAWGLLGDMTDRVCSVQTLQGNFAAIPFSWNDGARLVPTWTAWGASIQVFSSMAKKIAGECLTDIDLGGPFPIG